MFSSPQASKQRKILFQSSSSLSFLYLQCKFNNKKNETDKIPP